ncbi:YfhO family protein, partial [Ruminococcus champanellensis]
LDTMKSTDKEVAYSERRTYISYIQSGREITDRLYDYDKSFYRADKTYHRTVNDDLAFGLRGITHSSSVMNTRIIKFIEAMGYTCHSYYTKYNGATPISDSLLGIKYVLDQSDNVNESYHEVFSQMCKKQDQKEQLVTVYENPNAMSIGYMVSNTARRITGLGNDNPFNSQNVMMSTICGSTTFDPTTGAITGNTEYFYPIPQEGEPILNNLTARPYGVQTCYDVSGEGDHTIDMKFKALSDDPIYFFFKTENQRQVNLWYSPFWNKEGEFLDGEFLTYYFEGDDYRIVSLGSLPAGQEFTIRMTVTKEYTIFQNAFFYHFNQAKFEEDIAKLKQQQWEITDHSERWFKGTITAQEGQVMMTSIPYEEGWTVKVDGKKVEPIVLFNAMIGVQLSPGTHEVEMSFLPNGFTQGLMLMLLGIAACVGLGLYDHKHNKALLAAVAARRQAQAEYITKRRAKRRTK